MSSSKATSGPLYSPDQVANRLGLHVRTVRRYIREDRLRAIRIGRRYRVPHGELEAFAGHPFERPAPARSEVKHVDVSSIVEIDSIETEAANRLTNALVASLKGRDERDPPLRVDTVYQPERHRLKVMISGSIPSTSVLLALISTHLER